MKCKKRFAVRTTICGAERVIQVGDEAVYTEEDDRVVRAAIPATTLEAEQERGNIEVNTSGSGEDNMEHQGDLTDFVPPTSYDSPLLGGHTPGSDEGRPNINELMAICTQLSNKVLALEQSKTTEDLVIKQLQKKVKRLEKKQMARTPGMDLFKIGTSRRQSLDKENVSKQERSLKTMPMFEKGDIDDDFDDIDDMVDEAMKNVERYTVNACGVVNTANTEVSAASASVTTAGMRSEKAKEKGVPFRYVEESARPKTILPTINPKDKGKGIMQEPKKPPKNPRKVQIQLDEELAKRMHEEEMAELEKRQSEISAAEEANKAAINQELDDIQDMIEADEQMAVRLQSEEQEQFTIEEKSRMLVEIIAKRKRSYDEIQKLFDKAYKQVNSFVPMDFEVVKDSEKKDDSSSKQAGSRKKRAGLKLKPKSPKKLKVMKKQESAVDEQEKEELRLCLKIVQDEDRVINYETLAVKSPIVDWESQLVGSDLQEEDLSYWKITRVDGSSRFYKVFSTMLKEFDRQNLFDLHRLVMKRFEFVAPEGYDLIF
uniref:Uncharacterized protein n=1 Tax=Tanacetum cinerariifolium TaxID=118510 RepID=A0A6L2LQF6_TANCI|nr:hypothetical protein [Tanacetum cinerariifolium]